MTGQATPSRDAYSPLSANRARPDRQRHGRRLPRRRPPRVPGSGRQDRPGGRHRDGRRVCGLRRHRRRQPAVGRGRHLARAATAGATTGCAPRCGPRPGRSPRRCRSSCCRCSPSSPGSSSTRSVSCAELGGLTSGGVLVARLYLARADRVRPGIPAVGPAARAADLAGVVRRHARRAGARRAARADAGSGATTRRSGGG